MSLAKQQCVWSKRAAPAWIAAREAEIALCSKGAHVIIEQPRRRRAEVQVCCNSVSDAAKLRARFGGSIERLRRDWLEAFMGDSEHAPMRVGKRLTLLSQGEPARDRLVIPAGAAFGTGEHATTAMSLRLLEQNSRRLRAGWRLFDAGTGSGILALAAARFGAAEIIALDNDPLAIKTARANAAANKIRGVNFVVGDARRPPGRGKFDIITANLFSELLIKALPLWNRRLRSGGAVILSGILRMQERDVVNAARRQHLDAVMIRRRGKWVAILAAATQKAG
jgi:ribosomal protein L11 methyltransferase